MKVLNSPDIIQRLFFRNVCWLRFVQGKDSATSLQAIKPIPLGGQPVCAPHSGLWRLGGPTEHRQQRVLRGRGPHRLRMRTGVDRIVLLLGPGAHRKCDPVVSRYVAPVATHVLRLSDPSHHHVHLLLAHERHRPPEQSPHPDPVPGQRRRVLRLSLCHIRLLRGARHPNTQDLLQKVIDRYIRWGTFVDYLVG